MNRGRWPAEAELIPFTAGFPPGRRWLVLAPHPDDETFGLGGTLALGARRGVEIRVAVVTDGGAQGDAAEREGEARAAAAALGVPEPEFWRVPDRTLGPGDRALLSRIGRALDRHRPDVLFVTSPVEFHPDHRALAEAARRAVRAATLWGLRRRPPEWIAAYEVGAPLRPNLLVAADEAWECKLRAVGCYPGQMAFRRYHDFVEALGTVRALTLDGVRKAEAFHLSPAARVVRRRPSWWAAAVGVSGGAAARPGVAPLSPRGDGNT